jgi:hypothetical protein
MEHSEGVQVVIYKGEDGVMVVQIGTPDDRLMADNGMPTLRVRMNDARIWEGFKDGTEVYGDD